MRVAITLAGDCFGPAGLAMTGRGCAPRNDGPLCHRERQRRVAITWTGDCFGPAGLAMTGRGCAPRNDRPLCHREPRFRGVAISLLGGLSGVSLAWFDPALLCLLRASDFGLDF